MSRKKKNPGRKLRRDLAIYLTTRVVLSLPRRCYLVITESLLTAGLLLSQRVRLLQNLVVANLRHLFPDKRPYERRLLFRQITRRLLINFYEVKHLPSRRWVSKTVTVTGQELLDEALARNKGVVCLAAHLGNFPLLLTYFSQQGYPVNTINRKFHNRFLEDYTNRIRQQATLPRIPKYPTAGATREALRWLKRGGILFILADQHSDRGVTAPLFNQPVKTPAGPAMLALRTGCPILPLSIKRRGRRHLIRVEPPLPLYRDGEFQAAVQKNTTLCNQVLERWVREDPLEWSSWFNQRFLAP